MENSSANSFSSGFFDKIRDQLKPFDNLKLILCKIEMDSTLQSLTSLFTQIFEKEVTFGLKGQLIRVTQYEKQTKRD